MNVKERVKELLSKMTVEEKVAQLSCTLPLTLMKGGKVQESLLKKDVGTGVGRMTQFAAGFLDGAVSAAEEYNKIQKHMIENTRLGIPALIQNETAAGLVAPNASIFPVPIALASTWQPELAEDMGNIIRDQAKAIGVRQCLSPVADVARDARWGRVGETFGEDTTLVTQFSIAKTKGLQGENYGDNVISCAKHFMGYGASEAGVNTAVINLGAKELFEVYGTPFAGMIKEANLQCVMVTYSEIDGLPMSVNEHYMKKVLREDMEFDGSAICDALSISKAHNDNDIEKDEKSIAIRALKTGIDADTPITSAYHNLVEAVKNGEVSEEVLDLSVGRILKHKFDLGLFEQPYVDIEHTKEVYSSTKGDQVSKSIAQKEITLLKNDGILPLKEGKKIALIGPFANRTSILFGGYAYPSFLEMMFWSCDYGKSKMEGVGEVFDKLIDKDYVRKKLKIKKERSYEENLESYLKETYQVKSLYEEMIQNDVNVQYARGCSNEENNDLQMEEAVKIANDSDVILVTLGEVTGFGKEATSGEGINNYDLNLPGNQEKLLQKLCETGKPVVLILFNGRPLSIPYATDHCSAIVEVWYPGLYGPEAINQVLWGKTNPGGKLPITFPRSSGQCPIYYSHKASSGYRPVNFDLKQINLIKESNNAPLFHFGHGLSYTSFTYKNIAADSFVIIGEVLKVSMTIQNSGKYKGDDVVQVYTHIKGASVSRPVMELKAFKRVTLDVKEEKNLVFEIDTRSLGYFNKENEYVVEPREMQIMIGSSSIDIRLETNINICGEEKQILHDRVYSFQAYETK